jgi:ABC-type uncharacterized transport system substrate-binding protein
MRRIGLAVVLALSMFLVPLAAETQPRQVGWLALVAEPLLQDEFRRGMRELGHVEGSTYSLHERYAGNRAEALPGLAAELTRLKLDVIVAETGPAARTAKNATTETPIVFITSDPLGTGLVQSLARPGGNLTGISNIQTELYPKRLEMLKAAIPTLRRVATIEHMAFGRRTLLSQMVQETARALGIEALTITFVGRVEELDRAFAQARAAACRCRDVRRAPLLQRQHGAHPGSSCAPPPTGALRVPELCRGGGAHVLWRRHEGGLPSRGHLRR